LGAKVRVEGAWSDEKREAAERETRAAEICGRGLGKWWRWGRMCCCRNLVLAAEAGAGGTRSRTLTVDASGGGCSEVPARRRR